MAEIVRSGIQSIPKGQWEAAAALGLTYYRTMRHVVLPQALRVMIPPTIGVYVSRVKESSLASIIGFLELLGQGMAIRESNAGRSTADLLVAVALGYFAICYPLSGARLDIGACARRGAGIDVQPEFRRRAAPRSSQGQVLGRLAPRRDGVTPMGFSEGGRAKKRGCVSSATR